VPGSGRGGGRAQSGAVDHGGRAGKPGWLVEGLGGWVRN
jgi:hypothetical protein